MTHDRKTILEYWDKDDVESMYDKNLINAEIDLIKRHIQPNSKILDAGCGEGEGTIQYSRIPGAEVHGADFSDTRLRKARERLKGCKNVTLKKIDFLDEHALDEDYDIVVSQRFLINFNEWALQCKVILDLLTLLKSGGKFLMLEGHKQGVNSLNEVRSLLDLDPIPVKWHNLFFDNYELIKFMKESGYKLVEQDSLSAYFFLTRGIRPALDKDLNWDCKFNSMVSSRKIENLLGFGDKFSRLKLWVFQK